MNSSKVWAILTTRTLLPSMAPGGQPRLTPALVARLLHGLPRDRFLIGMAKEAGDVSVLRELEGLLGRTAQEIAEWMEWPAENTARNCRELAGLAVFEVLIPRPVRCTTCHGRGWRYSGAAHIECFECRNTGGTPLSSRSRSELAGITWSRWRESWQPRYEAVYLTAEGWLSDARTHLARSLQALDAAA